MPVINPVYLFMKRKEQELTLNQPTQISRGNCTVALRPKNIRGSDLGGTPGCTAFQVPHTLGALRRPIHF